MKKEKAVEKKECKKAQASIIVTVLLVLVGIAAVIILASWIIPMVRDNLAEANVRANIYIDREGTFYNSNTNTDCPILNGCISSPLTYVRVKREAGDAQLVGIKFIFHKADRSFMYINKKVPSELEYRTYSFQLIGENKPDSVSIAPIVLVNGKEKTLDITDTVELKILSANFAKSTLETCSTPVQSSQGIFPPLPPECPNGK